MFALIVDYSNESLQMYPVMIEAVSILAAEPTDHVR
jgi:hypothetical protein